jgi:GT2 family glycosyltransferase
VTALAVTVVVPNRNGEALLERCLASLEAQTFRDFEVVVVDNGSSDGSRELVRRQFPSAALVELDGNRGFAGGSNAGAAQARGAAIAFANNDVEAEPEWLEELLACLGRHPRAASVASKILRRDDARVLDGAGDQMTRSLKAFRRGQGERDRGQYEREEQVFSASGTACLWRADVFRRLGGFDERFHAYYEDVDLGFRARRAGWECWYAPRGVVHHVGGGTSGERWSEFESFYAVRNRWATIAKNAPTGWLVRNAPLVVAGELASLGRALARGELRFVLRAYRELLGSADELRAQRAEAARGAVAGYRDLRPALAGAFPPARSTMFRLGLARRFASSGAPAA